MPRIRTIKPKFWDDVKIGRLSRDARLLYIGLWTFADDLGVVIADPIWLKSKIFPYDKLQIQQIEAWIQMLEKTGFICHVTVESESFIYLPTFSRHQKIDRPNLEEVNISKEQLYRALQNSSNNRRSIVERSSTIVVEDKDIEPPIIPHSGDGDDVPDEFVSLWDSFKGKRKSLADDYRGFCKKTDGLTVDYVKLLHHARFAKNVYFQTWINTFFAKKSKRELDLSAVEPTFQPIVADWLAYKSERGQTYRQRGFAAFYEKLRELSGDSPDAALQIVRQSMANNWAGIFALKNTNHERSTTNKSPGPDELAWAVAEGIARANTRQEWEL